MKNKFQNLLIDRALLMQSVLNQRDSKSLFGSESTTNYALNYKYWVYESPGMSVIEHTLHTNKELGKRLVSIPHPILEKVDEELLSLKQILETWCNKTTIVHSIQLFERSMANPARAYFIHLEYLVRLLLLSKHQNASIMPWQPRIQLFKSFFESVGFTTNLEELEEGLFILKADGDNSVELPIIINKTYHLLFSLPKTEYTNVGSPLQTIPKNGKIFLSYSHTDEIWRDRLLTHLKPILGPDQLMIWSDKEIEVGSEWKNILEKKMDEANIAVLLVSHSFLSSEYITKYELPILLNKNKNKELRIIWIAVSSSLFDKTEIRTIQSANNPDKPLDLLPQAIRNRELVHICKIIKEAADNL